MSQLARIKRSTNDSPQTKLGYDKGEGVIVVEAKGVVVGGRGRGGVWWLGANKGKGHGG